MPGIDVFSDGFSDGHPHRGFFDATQWQWESQQWDNTMLSPCYYLESHSKRCCVPIYYLENWKSSSILAKCLVPIGTLALSKVAEILVTGKCAILGLRYFYGYLRIFTALLRSCLEQKMKRLIFGLRIAKCHKHVLLGQSSLKQYATI